MPNFAEEVKELPGVYKSNIFGLLIAKLSNFSTELVEDKLIIRSLLYDIKVFFHNHSQQLAALTFILKQNLSEYKGLSTILLSFITEVVNSLEDPSFLTYFEKKASDAPDTQCRLQRIFESHVATKMLLNPSKGMWASVNHISDVIVGCLESGGLDKAFELFLTNLGPRETSSEMPHLALAFGHFDHTPTIDEVVTVLKAKSNLTLTMLIHFLFMRDVSPYLKLGLSSESRAHKGGDFGAFLKEKEEVNPLAFFCNYPKYAPHLYTDRGRAAFEWVASKRMGIALLPTDRGEFPAIEGSWFPDTLCQQVDIRSSYVKAITDHDIPYVSGPSGMTSVFCGAMVFLGGSTLEEQYDYLLAVMAFMTSGGLHSIHEVLSVPQVRLGLFPGYRALGPDAGNYQQFFALFHADEVVNQNIADAWKATIDWIARHYPHLIPIHRDTTSSIKIEDEGNIVPQAEEVRSRHFSLFNRSCLIQ